MRRFVFALSILACSPLERSESKQVADATCVDSALVAHLARPNDEFVIAAGYFCIERGKHNQRIEDALRATGGAKAIRTDDGFQSSSVAGAGVGGATIENLWLLDVAGAAGTKGR